MTTAQMLSKRTTYANSIIRASKWTKSAQTNATVTLGTVQAQLELLEVNWGKFVGYQIAIEEVSGKEEIRFQQVEMENGEGAYIEAKSVMLDMIARLSSLANAALAPVPPQPRENNSIKLPRIEIPKFNGDVLNWRAFHDLFEAVIGQKMQLSGSEKLQYLKGFVEGEPSLLIRAFPNTDANFREAWDSLIARYDNKRLTVNAHFKAMFSHIPVSTDQPAALRKLIDAFKENTRALNALDLPTNSWDAFLVYMLTQRIDSESHKQWELSLSNNELPTFLAITTFLETRCRSLEAIETASTMHEVRAQTSKNRKSVHSLHSSSPQTTAATCVHCKQSHQLTSCPEYLNSEHGKRSDMVRQHMLCFNCLRPNHMTQTCRSGCCRICSGRHHTTLHNPRQTSSPSSSEPTSAPPPRLSSSSNDSAANDPETSSSSGTAVASHHGHSANPVLLSTAIVNVASASGSFESARVLLDSGSQASFVTERCLQRLRLPKRSISIPVTGLGETSSGTSRGLACMKIRSCTDPKFQIDVNALVLARLTSHMPAVHISSEIRQHFGDIELADPMFYEPKDIDMIIGSDVYGKLLIHGLIPGADGIPTAQRTKFGWVLSGPVTTTSSIVSLSTAVSLHAHLDLEKIMRRFWEIETLVDADLTTAEEKLVETHFQQTHQRNEHGQYIVELPFNEQAAPLGLSRLNALRSFAHLEKRFATNSSLKAHYLLFIAEYKELEHMSLAEPLSNKDASYYLPHHAVFKGDKIRVVFDASRKSSTGVSLNDRLLIGPKLQDNLTSIILRFRQHRIAFTCDITKMYRQFVMAEKHRNFQRIIWRANPDEPLEEYRLNTVTYGTASASFLAVRCLQQLAHDERHRFPAAAKVTLNSFYVDDLMTGCDSIVEAIKLQGEIIHLLKCAGLELRKWSSNKRELLQNLPQGLRSSDLPLEIDPTESIKTLGLHWCPAADHFIFRVQLSSSPHSPPTKRSVMSEIAKLFDPLGWLSPAIIIAKVFLQELWTEGLEYDQPLNEQLSSKWLSYRSHLHCLEQVKIERWFGTSAKDCTTLHGFADASETAYSAVVYARTVRAKDSSVVISIITAKTRVAPVKQVTIARLELCAAVLLVKVLAFTQQALQYKDVDYCLWTDSSVVLNWIRKTPRTWNTFVANRVSEIQSLTAPDKWRHVPTADNPADCASRGLSPADLPTHELWWHGPVWLLHPEPQWPKVFVPSDASQEKRVVPTTAVLTAHTTDSNELLQRYSLLKTLIRTTAWILRFAHNCRENLPQRRSGPLSPPELSDSLISWIKIVQSSEFLTELKCCVLKQNLPNKSKLHEMKPFIDGLGLLRVGGRVNASEMSYDFRHPIILPTKNILTNLIIAEIHERNFHAGVQLTLCSIRQRFWFSNARRVIKQHIHSCNRCFRYRKNIACQQIIGDLPKQRLTPSRPFLSSGVDYAGPISIRATRGRGAKILKGYIAVFVCFVTRAVHMELVSELTSAAFIAAYRRFISRRGKCKDLHSDCGTNFVGANKELRELHKLLVRQSTDASVTNVLATEGTRWHFIPPGSPNFGGLWEAAVKSAKNHLRRTIGATLLTLEEMTTALCQVEACLNSRPLCSMSDDPEDNAVLTPGHFLIGEPLNLMPDPSVMHITLNRLDRWQLVQRIVQDTWKRWKNEYMSSLQHSPKWSKSAPNVAVGDLVLITDEQTPPAKWSVARVTCVHPGPDGKVRVATVKNSSGTVKRNVRKLCVLPTQ